MYVPALTPVLPLTITGTPGAATQNVAYAFTPTTGGGTGPFTFALTGTLPTGLLFWTATGGLSGTPTVAGTATGLAITVTDSAGALATRGPLSVTVAAATTSNRFDSTGWSFDSSTFPSFDMAA